MHFLIGWYREYQRWIVLSGEFRYLAISSLALYGFGKVLEIC
ncbi:MAG: hypothetical protein WC699_13885 [Bacteroidales bacterium]